MIRNQKEILAKWTLECKKENGKNAEIARDFVEASGLLSFKSSGQAIKRKIYKRLPVAAAELTS